MEFEDILKEYNEIIEGDTELLSAFSNYCKSRGSNINDKDFNIWFNTIKKYPKNRQKQLFIYDDAFEKFADFSLKIYYDSIEKIQNKDANYNYNDNTIEQLKSMYEKVREFNKDRAKRLLDDAITEIEYVNNPKSKKMSLRLAQLINDDMCID